MSWLCHKEKYKGLNVFVDGFSYNIFSCKQILNTFLLLAIDMHSDMYSEPS